MFSDNEEDSKEVNKEDSVREKEADYLPSELILRNPKPDTITLPQGVSRKHLLKETTATATRYKLSSTQHLAMVSSTVSAAGGDMGEVVASHATITRHHKMAQKENADEIKSCLKNEMPEYKIIHWDGKITEFLNEFGGGVYQDVNAVVLSAPLMLKPKSLKEEQVNYYVKLQSISCKNGKHWKV